MSPPETAEPSPSAYTPLGRRALAAFIDGILFLILVVFVAGAIAFLLPANVETRAFAVSIWILVPGVPIFVWSAVAGREPTPGEKYGGVTLCDHLGGRPSSARVALRIILWWLGVVLAFIGPISVLFMRNREGIHGRLSRTHVRTDWGPGMCACCGYNLSDRVGGRCPECGFEQPTVATKTGGKAHGEF